MKVKATKNISPFWKRDGFASELHYKAAKRGGLLRGILLDNQTTHPAYITARVAEHAGMIKV